MRQCVRPSALVLCCCLSRACSPTTTSLHPPPGLLSAHTQAPKVVLMSATLQSSIFQVRACARAVHIMSHACLDNRICLSTAPRTLPDVVLNQPTVHPSPTHQPPIPTKPKPTGVLPARGGARLVVHLHPHGRGRYYGHRRGGGGGCGAGPRGVLPWGGAAGAGAARGRRGGGGRARPDPARGRAQPLHGGLWCRGCGVVGRLATGPGACVLACLCLPSFTALPTADDFHRPHHLTQTNR